MQHYQYNTNLLINRNNRVEPMLNFNQLSKVIPVIKTNFQYNLYHIIWFILAVYYILNYNSNLQLKNLYLSNMRDTSLHFNFFRLPLIYSKVRQLIPNNIQLDWYLSIYNFSNFITVYIVHYFLHNMILLMALFLSFTYQEVRLLDKVIHSVMLFLYYQDLYTFIQYHYLRVDNSRNRQQIQHLSNQKQTYLSLLNRRPMADQVIVTNSYQHPHTFMWSCFYI